MHHSSNRTREDSCFASILEWRHHHNKQDSSGKPVLHLTLLSDTSKPMDGVLWTFISRVFLFAVCSVRMNVLVPFGDATFGVMTWCSSPATCLTFELIGTCYSFDICSNVWFSANVAWTASAQYFCAWALYSLSPLQLHGAGLLLFLLEKDMQWCARKYWLFAFGLLWWNLLWQCSHRLILQEYLEVKTIRVDPLTTLPIIKESAWNCAFTT